MKSLADLDSCKNFLFGRDLLIVGTGPGAKSWSQVLSKMSTSTYIIALKRAIEFEGLNPNMHIFNSYNCRNYSQYISSTCNSIFVDDVASPPQFNSFDFRFCVQKSTTDPFSDCLVVNKDLERYKIQNSGILRPWGPGIMYEIVIFLIQHFSPRITRTVGFDLALPGRNIEHYYPEDVLTPSCSSSSVSTKRYDKWYKNKYLHDSMFLYNTGCQPMNGEIKMVIDFLPSIIQWLNSYNLEIFFHTNSIALNHLTNTIQLD